MSKFKDIACDWYTDLGNYYGSVGFSSKGGKFYMTLEDWDGDRGLEISEAFFMAAQKEFQVDEDESITTKE